MPKFDFSKHELPTPYEQELLGIFREECDEASIRASKMQRFGTYEVQPGQNLTNAARLSQEIGDVLACVELMIQRGLVDEDVVRNAKLHKLTKIRDWMQHEPD